MDQLMHVILAIDKVHTAPQNNLRVKCIFGTKKRSIC